MTRPAGAPAVSADHGSGPGVEATSGWYVYGIVRADDGPGAVEGITGAGEDGVMLLAHADLAAVVEPLAQAGEATASRFVRAHARVLDTVATRCAVLPVRFGT